MQFRFNGGFFEFPRKRCVVFGILNITPDSFSDGGKFNAVDRALEHAIRLEKEGADILDIGAESTRPGAHPVTEQEELRRLLPVLNALKGRLRIPISIDTTKAEVARVVLGEGVQVINDVSGLSDPDMIPLLARETCGVILMHSRGTPQTMQQQCEYVDLAGEVRAELWARCQAGCERGISLDRMALDPGLGFAKTKDQNWRLMEKMGWLVNEWKRPVLLGVSRKSFLGGEVSGRGPATLKAELEGLRQGVQMIRTHDVAALRAAEGAGR